MAAWRVGSLGNSFSRSWLACWEGAPAGRKDVSSWTPTFCREGAPRVSPTAAIAHKAITRAAWRAHQADSRPSIRLRLPS